MRAGRIFLVLVVAGSAGYGLCSRGEPPAAYGEISAAGFARVATLEDVAPNVVLVSGPT